MDIHHPPVNTETPMSDEKAMHAVRTEEYSTTLPTAPRIPVPPMVYNHSPGGHDVELGKVMSNPDPRLNVDFLNSIDIKSALRTPPTGWSYAERREAQEVLSFLYIGPLIAAKNKDFLQRAGITMMLGIQPKGILGTRVTAAAFKAAEDLGIEHSYITADGPRDLIVGLQRSTDLINEHIAGMHHRVEFGATPSREGKVLVFCESGNDKAATVVAAYLMAMFEHVDLVKAAQIVMHARFCTSITEELKQVLVTYESIVRAQRGVQRDRARTPKGWAGEGEGAGAKSKRRYSYGADEDEMEVDGERADDEERFRGRSITPFA